MTRSLHYEDRIVTSAEFPDSESIINDSSGKTSAEGYDKVAVSLDQAVAAFNRNRFDVERVRQPALTKDQIPAPLTVEEVVSAIRNWDRKKRPIADKTYALFSKIAETKMLQPGIKGFQRMDQWFVDHTDGKYENRIWRIDLDVRTGKNTGYTFPIRELRLGRRVALPATPGYSWAVEPHPDLGPAGYSWGGCVFYVGEDGDGALVIVVSRIGESLLPDLRVVAFDDDARRYELKRRGVGAHTDRSGASMVMQRFRLDPAKLPRNKVRYWGIESKDPSSEKPTKAPDPDISRANDPSSEASAKKPSGTTKPAKALTPGKLDRAE